MNGADTVSPSDANLTTSDGHPVAVVNEGSRRGRRRRRHSHRSLGEKLKRHHTANRLRRIVWILVTGVVVIGVSMFLAHQANEYVPVPTYPAP